MSNKRKKATFMINPPQKKQKLNNNDLFDEKKQDTNSKVLSRNKSTISITFGDVSENHVGMEKNGEMAEEGFNINDLKNYEKTFHESHGNKTELIILNEYLSNDIKNNIKTEAAVLIIRNGIDSILKCIDKNIYDLYNEQSLLPIDTKYYDRRRKKVLNKNARGNLCFDDIGHNADYENGKGTVISYNDVPLTKYIRKQFSIYFGKKAKNLTAEGNYYYDIKKCGIGFHGDAERKKVIAFRLGQTMPLHYQWFYKFNPIGKRCEFLINEGDIYIMSEKATGFDWRKSSIYTLRHAAGAKKYLTIKKRKAKKKENIKGIDAYFKKK
eukprot:164856_1